MTRVATLDTAAMHSTKFFTAEGKMGSRRVVPLDKNAVKVGHWRMILGSIMLFAAIGVGIACLGATAAFAVSSLQAGDAELAEKAFKYGVIFGGSIGGSICIGFMIGLFNRTKIY